MSSINTSQKGGVIRWDGSDWMTGLVSQWGIDTSRVMAPSGFATTSGIDPTRFPGYCSPGVNPTDLTNSSVVTSLLKDGVVSGSSAYMIGGGLLHKIADVLVSTVSSDATWPHTISAHGGHSSVSGQSTAIYSIGSTKYLFYSWSDNTDGDVGRYNLDATFDDDYMSTVPASAAVLDTTNPHPLIVGSDDILYIADGRNLHGFDGQTGANGTLSKNRLTLPADYVITSFAKSANYLVVYAYRANSSSSFYRSEATAFFWDYVSEDTTLRYPLQGNYVSGGFSYQNGSVGCFVEGQSTHITTSKTSKMLLYNGSGFETRATFSDGIPDFGGVEVYDETVVWNSDGKVYQWGSPHLGFPISLNRTSILDGTTGGGMLRNFARTRLITSSGTGTSGGCNVLSGNYAPGSFTTNTVDIPAPLYAQVKIEAVKVFYQSTRTAGSHTLTLVLNLNRSQNSATVIDYVGYVGSDRQDPPTNLVSVFTDTFDAKSFGTATALSLSCTWNSVDATKKPAIIEAVEVHFTYENI